MVASPPPPDSPTHNDLMAAVASRRDRIAFASLFNHFAPRIKSYMGRLGTDRGAAEELAQEVMFTVWHRADTFDPSQSSVGTWIFTIARNRRIDMLRRERRPELDPDDPALVPLPDPAADDCLSAAQSERRLREALTLLPKEQADLLQCAFYDDKPHRTIAEEQQLPLGTVKSRIRLALARLRKALEDTV